MTYTKDTIEFVQLPPFYKFLNLTGHVFTRLTVLGYAGKASSFDHLWWVQCECGTIKTARSHNLRNGSATSCGCRKQEVTGNRSRTHGQSTTDTYHIWERVRRRCFSVSSPDYPDYGGRGITLCQGFCDFTVFAEQMGNRPTKAHSIDRIDNEQGYTCGQCVECVANTWTMNCRWATPKQQARNRRSNHQITINGDTRILMEWLEYVHLSETHFYTRINKLGMSEQEAIQTPTRNNRQHLAALF